MTLDLASILALPLIGEGNFRRVYRDDDVVYKVEYDEGKELGTNIVEYQNYYRLQDTRLPDNVRLPEFCSLLMAGGDDVIRMPFIDGELIGECFCLPGEEHIGCLPPGLERDLNVLGIDCAYGNIILADSTYYLIDLDADLR